jgi:hypothetical protein
MTEPRVCSECGATPVRTRGLCGRCDMAQRHRDHPELAKPSLLADRTAYLEEITTRNRAWYEQHYAEKLAREQEYSRRSRQAFRARREESTGPRPDDGGNAP